MDIDVNSDTWSEIVWNYDAGTESEHDWRRTETERTEKASKKYDEGKRAAQNDAK